ncbi:MAG: polyprenyl synthetase family protein [Asgard group archaeon]|nr:polyprenyl synthetase family protein [Asgard group archaeon]
MEIKETLVEIAKSVHEELVKLFTANGIKREQLGKFGELFYDELDGYLTNGGKRVRPFLTITAFNAVDGDHTQGNIVRAALAIELLHNGSLLHDDVIDKDETRRGRPAFRVVFRDVFSEKKQDKGIRAVEFGEAMSIFAGDLCFPYAIESLTRSGFPEERSIRALHSFAQAFREVIDGVILETGDAILHDGNEETYKLMISLKTGALIRKAIEIGAILGNGTQSQIDALVKYCDGIGTAFQIQDDILGVFGDPDETGKPVGGDVREDKQTILRIKAMKEGTKNQIERLKALMGKRDLTKEELDEVRLIYKKSGSLDYSLQMIEKATKDAIDALDEADPALKDEPKNHLIALAMYLAARKK